ncbi:hypothetical protein FFIC_260350 [Fructobacillus ficulneus]|uniref:Uncharacterized protein n=1 Tax=Fructobacillus ficulneus TaxID=157463 RepID=A0A0K8MH79_9LACO|nr:hypothetical protein FFIC_260350 [Fructobacillus ficulneus]
MTDPKIPKATPRSAPSKLEATKANDKVINPAPPKAWTTRPMSKTKRFGARPLTADEITKTTILIKNIFFRPYMSPNLAKTKITTAYEIV